MKKQLAASLAAVLFSGAVYAENDMDHAPVEGMDTAHTTFEGQNLLGGETNQYSGDNNATDNSVDNSVVDSSTRVNNNYAQGKPMGYVSAPMLTTGGLDTCLGSASGGISAPGIGISGGKTTVDKNCVLLKKVKLLESLGLKDAGVALLIIEDPKMGEAIKAAYPALYDHLAVETTEDEPKKSKKHGPRRN